MFIHFSCAFVNFCFDFLQPLKSGSDIRLNSSSQSIVSALRHSYTAVMRNFSLVWLASPSEVSCFILARRFEIPAFFPRRRFLSLVIRSESSILQVVSVWRQRIWNYVDGQTTNPIWHATTIRQIDSKTHGILKYLSLHWADSKFCAVTLKITMGKASLRSNLMSIDTSQTWTP